MSKNYKERVASFVRQMAKKPVELKGAEDPVLVY